MREVTFAANVRGPQAAQQQLGSANLHVRPPASRTFDRSPIAVACNGPIVAGVIQLRNLAVQPGHPLRSPSPRTCRARRSRQRTWKVAAKQSNDFNGPGNDLTLDAVHSSITTSVTGACVTQPCPPNGPLQRHGAVGAVDAHRSPCPAAGSPPTCCWLRKFGKQLLGPPGSLTARTTGALTFDEATYDYTGAGAKIATLRIDKSAIAAVPNNGATSLQAVLRLAPVIHDTDGHAAGRDAGRVRLEPGTA